MHHLGRASRHAERIAGLVDGGAALHSEIGASWSRCLNLHQIDPDVEPEDSTVEQRELAFGRESWGEDFVSADRILDTVGTVFQQAGFSLLLADAEGLVLASRTRTGGPERFATNLRDGMVWREDIQGTNGIGLGLQVKKPLVVFRDEHFLTMNTDLGCMVVPLFDAEGTLKGVLNATSVDTAMTQTRMQGALAALLSFAHQIEAAWFHNKYKDFVILSLSEPTNQTMSVRLVALNSDMQVVGATASVRSIHRLSSQMLADGVELNQLLPTADKTMGSFDDAEMAVMRRALARNAHNITHAAAELGISRSTLHRKLQRFDMKRKLKEKCRN